MQKTRDRRGVGDDASVADVDEGGSDDVVSAWTADEFGFEAFDGATPTFTALKTPGLFGTAHAVFAVDVDISGQALVDDGVERGAAGFDDRCFGVCQGEQRVATAVFRHLGPDAIELDDRDVAGLHELHGAAFDVGDHVVADRQSQTAIDTRAVAFSTGRCTDANPHRPDLTDRGAGEHDRCAQSLGQLLLQQREFFIGDDVWTSDDADRRVGDGRHDDDVAQGAGTRDDADLRFHRGAGDASSSTSRDDCELQSAGDAGKRGATVMHSHEQS